MGISTTVVVVVARSRGKFEEVGSAKKEVMSF
jgi:hypothetical protein